MHNNYGSLGLGYKTKQEDFYEFEEGIDTKKLLERVERGLESIVIKEV